MVLAIKTGNFGNVSFFHKVGTRGRAQDNCDSGVALYAAPLSRRSTLTVDELVRMAEVLSDQELDELTFALLSVAARRRAASVSQQEADLWNQIDRAFPADTVPRLKELNDRAARGVLGDVEQAELLRLTDRLEESEAMRWAALSEIAQLRGQTLAVLLYELRSEAERSKA
jgi:hypothetical protein